AAHRESASQRSARRRAEQFHSARSTQRVVRHRQPLPRRATARSLRAAAPAAELGTTQESAPDRERRPSVFANLCRNRKIFTRRRGDAEKTRDHLRVSAAPREKPTAQTLLIHR